MAEYIVKRPTDIRVERFDFGEKVAEWVAEGTLVADIGYTLRSSAGITVACELIDASLGLLDVTINGGQMGVVYDYGIEARTPSGDSDIDMRKVRVRDPSLFPLLPTDSEVVIGDFRIVTETGEVLVTETGEELAWA
jgi:hypothetical protein